MAPKCFLAGMKGAGRIRNNFFNLKLWQASTITQIPKRIKMMNMDGGGRRQRQRMKRKMLLKSKENVWHSPRCCFPWLISLLFPFFRLLLRSRPEKLQFQKVSRAELCVGSRKFLFRLNSSPSNYWKAFRYPRKFLPSSLVAFMLNPSSSITQVMYINLLWKFSSLSLLKNPRR